MKRILMSLGLITLLPMGAWAQSMPVATLDFLDANDDAQVSKDEMAQRMDLLFDPMDTDGDGQLEFDEVGEFISREAFDGADTNGNGKINLSEYRAQILKDFEFADSDGDGVLD